MEKTILGIEQLENKAVLTPVVAIIDSGIDLNHQALKSYIWTNPKEIPSNNMDDDHNGYVDDINGWNFVNNTNNVQDGFGHGTHVAGIVTSYGPVSIMVLKFQDDKGIGYTGDAIKAINYALMMKKDFGIDIVAINNSWGGSTGYSSLLDNAIKNAADNNIIFVTSAGNTGANHDLSPRYPSSYSQSNIISVAALGFDKTDLAGYSDYGKNSVNIAAVGSSVFSTLPNNTYGYMSGTSMAAPQITGAIAAICQKYGSLSVAEIKDKIFSTVDKLNTLADKVITGGSLNINKCLNNDVFKISIPSISVPWQDKILAHMDIMNINRIRGWVIDTNNPTEKIFVKVMINQKVVWSGEANRYRVNLLKFGNGYHGFDIKLNRYLFNRGWNTLNIIAENRETGESKMIATKNIRRIR